MDPDTDWDDYAKYERPSSEISRILAEEEAEDKWMRQQEEKYA